MGSRDEFISYLKDTAGASTAEVAEWKKMLQAGRMHQKDCGFHFGYRAKPNSCWDFAQGYCCRGISCRWVHDRCLEVDELGERRKRTAQQAFDRGVRLSREAIEELQSLPEDEADELVRSLSAGGRFSMIQNKNIFVCHEIRRRHAKK